MNFTEEQKQAFRLTQAFWHWTAETGFMKEKWNYYNELKKLLNNCAFCDYFIFKDCPLNKFGCNPNSCCGGIYQKWARAIDKGRMDRAKFYAVKIADRIDKWIIKEKI